MQKLARAGMDMRNYFGAFHPSQTNYLASLAGEVCAVTNDDPPTHGLTQETLVGRLQSVDVTWKAYMEGYPMEPWNPAWRTNDAIDAPHPINEYPTESPLLARYFRKHNAFASFRSIQSCPERWSQIVDDATFWADVHADTLPQYSWFTPDIWNDGHYLHNTHKDTDPRTQLVPQISTWLQYVFFGNIDASDVQYAASSGPKRLGLNLDIDLAISDPDKAWSQSRVPPGTLIVVTFDEADFNATGYDTSYEGPNQIYTVLLGDGIRPASVDPTPFNHYSLIKTIEKNYGCEDLGKNDRHANYIRQLWGERFEWSPASDTGVTTSDPLALVTAGEIPLLAFLDGQSELRTTELRNCQWSESRQTGQHVPGPFDLTILPAESCSETSDETPNETPDQILLVFVDSNGMLRQSIRTPTGEWSSAQSLEQECHGALTLTTYEDLADEKKKIMLWLANDDGLHQLLDHV